MSSFKNRVPINGSKRTIMVGAKRTEAVSLQEKMRVGLYLRCRKYSAGEPSLEKLMNNDSLDKTYLTHDEFELKHGAFPEDVIKVKEFLREHGLTIESINLSHRLIIFFHKANNMSFLSADHCGGLREKRPKNLLSESQLTLRCIILCANKRFIAAFHKKQLSTKIIDRFEISRARFPNGPSQFCSGSELWCILKRQFCVTVYPTIVTIYRNKGIFCL